MGQEEDDFQKEIQELFLMESSENLDKTESYLLILEKNPEDYEAFDSLLRVMHNLKGSGKSVGFDEISKFSHEIETLLVFVRAKEISFSQEIAGLLLKCCDRLKSDIVLLKMDRSTILEHQDLYELLSLAHHAKAQTEQITEQINDKELPQQECKNDKKGPLGSSDDFARVSLKKIEDLLNNFGEQVILQASLDHSKYDLSSHLDQALKTINQLSKLTYDLQQTVMALRMVGLKQVFSKMERITRDTAVAVSKKVNFFAEGQDNELDKTIVEAIADPLTHMIRNAIDHGLESEEERIAKGKDPCGKIILRGFRRGGFFYIIVEDDGRGLDKDKIFEKAVKVGLVRADQVLPESKIYELIYANGFSTRDTASDLSGRGVGMNVVKESIQGLKGSCQIESKPGEGTKFTIRLPLTLAIFNGMVIKVLNNLYIIPNSDIERVMALPKEGIRFVSELKEQIIQVDDAILPLIDLKERLATDGHKGRTTFKKADGNLVITHAGGIRQALVVDEIVSQQRVVHKSLGPEIGRLKGAAGATILGDGSPALILDIVSLLSTSEKAA